MAALLRQEGKQMLAKNFSWMKAPFIISAPMRVMTGPKLAMAVSSAGGLGFIGPTIKPEDVLVDLEEVQKLAKSSSIYSSTASSLLPIGVGFQTWNGDINLATKVAEKHRPCAVWLFAPRHGQSELDDWTAAVRKASPATQVWVQVGTLGEAMDAARSSHAPDVLVIQGAEAGGHGRATDGQGIIALLPEVSEALRGTKIPLIAAGGIVDGRGIAAALALGASGVAMGTRFLASTEARISKGYQMEVVRATDGGKNTVRTQLYNHLRGTFGWPEAFSPRTIINRSWEEHQGGTSFDALKERHDEAAKAGDDGWGPEGRLATYAGAAVGLVHTVDDASVIVAEAREQAREVLAAVAAEL